jgi:hypothetical protein
MALLYLVAKPVHVGVDVDMLAYPLHHPMVCGHQTRGPPARRHLVPSLQWGGGAFLGDVNPRAWIFGGALVV